MTLTMETTRFLEESHCLKDAVLIKFFLARIIETIGVILCIFVVLLMINVITKFIVPGAFHKNIKIILIFYLFIALLQSIYLTCYIFYSMISHEMKPCDIYLSRDPYVFGHLANFYLLLVQIKLQTLACIERVIATLSASYERRGASIGICFSLIALLSPLLVGYFVYMDADFDEPSVSVLITPSSVTVKMNACFMFGIGMCILSLLLFQFLCWYNLKVRDIVGAFSCIFQTNISKILFIIVITLVYVILLLLVYLIAGCGLLFFRLNHELWNYYDLTVQIIKTPLFLLPVFLFFLPILIKYHIRAGKRQRKKVYFEKAPTKTISQEEMEKQKIIYATIKQVGVW